MLDRIDRAILAALQKNGRLSNKELAAKVDLAPSSCLERVRKLRENGVLRGFYAEVDHRAVGIGVEAMIAVRLRVHSRQVVESFEAHALSQREVLQVSHVTGASDYLIHVAVPDLEYLRNLVLTAFTERPEVAQVQTSIMFANFSNHELPFYPAMESR
jgi:DNA-binding Lrp family transcriptional regulator